MEEQLLHDYKRNAIFRLEESLRMIKIAMEYTDDVLLWKTPFPNGMTLGNQLLHCCGNMTQYIITGLGNRPDNLKRNDEFREHKHLKKKDLLNKLEVAVNLSKRTIEEGTVATYIQLRSLQGFQLSGLGAVFHAVEHFSYHTGQIAFWVKQQTGKDLRFYAHHDLNQNNI